jgi:hypothetical protein
LVAAVGVLEQKQTSLKTNKKKNKKKADKAAMAVEGMVVE